MLYIVTFQLYFHTLTPTSWTARVVITFVQDTTMFAVMVLVNVYDLHTLTVFEDGNANSELIWTIIWVRRKYTAMMFWFMMTTMMVVFSFSYDSRFQFYLIFWDAIRDG
ncbi:hypothetical protein ZWY2020_008327 [Hordeum vulgare]|nr:hypothetical protein ZWY2020_008327 [Hordeum vulgare]